MGLIILKHTRKIIYNIWKKSLVELKQDQKLNIV
jgi:hypothetical protein